MSWWISSVFLPAHRKRNGDVLAILILDNFSGHNIDFSQFSDCLIVIFLPPNVTSRSQHADMGMISALKVGYKTSYLRKLLVIFDSPGGYEDTARRRARMQPGCKGIEFGGKG